MDRSDGTVPPDDEGWWRDRGWPEEHRSELIEYVMLCTAVHICRAEEATGDRYRMNRQIDDCPGADRVLDEAIERGAAAIRTRGAEGIGRLKAELDAELRADWPKRLPRPPDDDDDGRAGE
jgi:hypothetical protein